MSDPLVVRLMTIMYHIYHVSTGLQSGILKVKVSDGRHGMASCQTCVLDTLGAKRMKLESYWNVSGILLATYEISGSDFVFENLNLECTSYQKCIVQELEMFPSKNWQTTVSEEPIISPDNPLWFILGYTSSAKVLCMACLQQNAAARSVGKFRLTSRIGGDHNIYVVHDAKKHIERKLCKDVCTALYSPKYCGNFLDLLRALPFEDKRQSSPSKINHEAAKESNSPSHNALQCLWAQKVEWERVPEKGQRFCRICLAVHYGTATFSTRINSKHIVYVFAGTEQTRNEVKICTDQCGSIIARPLTSSDCRLNVDKHFRKFPDGQQILAPPPPGDVINSIEASSDRELSSGCVWAHHSGEISPCSKCLQKIRESTVHELSESTLLISVRRFEHLHFSRKEVLGNCVRHYKPCKIFSVPDAMCSYEMSFLTSLAQLNETALLKDTLKEPSSHSLPTVTNNITSPSFDSSSAHEIGIDELTQVGQASEHLPDVESETEGNQLTMGSDLGPPTTNVLVVHWTVNSLSCVLCLALYGEVLLFSVKRSYAWMIEGLNSAIACDTCGQLSTGQVMELNVFSMRSIRHSSIKWIYEGYAKELFSKKRKVDESKKKKLKH